MTDCVLTPVSGSDGGCIFAKPRPDTERGTGSCTGWRPRWLDGRVSGWLRTFAAAPPRVLRPLAGRSVGAVAPWTGTAAAEALRKLGMGGDGGALRRTKLGMGGDGGALRRKLGTGGELERT
jgi:hypothetical protein